MPLSSDQLTRNPIFSTLSTDRQNVLLQQAVLRRLHKGEILTHRGDTWPFLFLVTHGVVKALKESSEGRSLIVANFSPGDIFWGMAFFDCNMPMLVSLEAGANTQIAVWTRESILHLLKSDADFSWQVMCLMMDRMAHASQVLEEIAFQPVASRLARLLLENSKESSQATISRSMTLDEMAARIASTREVVCRFLHRFADEGIIDITRTEFNIIDSEKLNKVSQANKG